MVLYDEEDKENGKRAAPAAKQNAGGFTSLSEAAEKGVSVPIRELYAPSDTVYPHGQGFFSGLNISMELKSRLEALVEEAQLSKNAINAARIDSIIWSAKEDISDTDYEGIYRAIKKKIKIEYDEGLEHNENLEHENLKYDDKLAVPKDDGSGSPDFDYYKREVNKYPLLTKEEEQHYGKILLKARQAKKAGKCQAFYDNPEVEEARNNLINSSLRLVISIARKYTASGIPFLDLVQEGNYGLIYAADKFDYRKNTKFSTHATWWIRQRITRRISESSSIIDLPAHTSEFDRRMRRISEKLSTKLERKPTLKEIGDVADVSKKKMENMENVARTRNIVSLDAMLGGDADYTMYDVLTMEIVDPGRDIGNPQDDTDKTITKEMLSATLQKLTYKQRTVIEMRFGLIDCQERTLEEVGDYFNMTRERIRQIEAKSLRKLRRIARKDFPERFHGFDKAGELSNKSPYMKQTKPHQLPEYIRCIDEENLKNMIAGLSGNEQYLINTFYGIGTACKSMRKIADDLKCNNKVLLKIKYLALSKLKTQAKKALKNAVP